MAYAGHILTNCKGICIENHPRRRKPEGPLADGRYGIDKGLSLVVEKGHKRYAFRFTSPATGRVTEKSLGRFELRSFKAARQAALKLELTVSEGLCPNAIKKEEKRAWAGKPTFAELAAVGVAQARDEKLSDNHI